MCFEKLKVPLEFELILLDFWSLLGNLLGWKPSKSELRAQGNNSSLLLFPWFHPARLELPPECRWQVGEGLQGPLQGVHGLLPVGRPH